MRDIALSLSLAGLAFIMTAIWGNPLLRILRHFKLGKIIRIEQPEGHRVKMGTPTMGGVMFIMPVLMLSGLLNAVALIGVTTGGERSVAGLDLDSVLGDVDVALFPGLIVLAGLLAQLLGGRFAGLLGNLSAAAQRDHGDRCDRDR